MQEPPDEITRAALIRKAWEHVKACREQKGYPQAFDDMVTEIKKQGGDLS
jgi:hypothetical protein